MPVADEIGARACEAPSLGSIANNDQSTTEMLDSAGVIQDPGEMFLSRDSADKPEYNRPRVSIV